MSIANDGSTHCDACAGQFFPGCSYSDGSTDVVFEVWPGFHACLACTREKFAREHRAGERAEAMCAIRFRCWEVQRTRDEPYSVRLSTLALAAWEAAEPVRDGTVEYQVAMAKLLGAAVSAGIDPVTARRTVASALAEVRSWATAA